MGEIYVCCFLRLCSVLRFDAHLSVDDSSGERNGKSL